MLPLWPAIVLALGLTLRTLEAHALARSTRRPETRVRPMSRSTTWIASLPQPPSHGSHIPVAAGVAVDGARAKL